MPWQPEDAARYTHRVSGAKSSRKWAHVANSVRKRGGDEGAAVRAANASVKGRSKRRSRRGRRK